MVLVKDTRESTVLESKSPNTPAAKGKYFRDEGEMKKLEIVVKCDVVGSLDAVVAGIGTIREPNVDIQVVHSGVGPVSKSDVLLALTAGKLVIGFNQEVMPRVENFAKENGVEIRLYNVIYRLIEDLREIARNFLSEREPEEKVTGKARVIALFKSRRKGIILGCEVQEGTLVVGKDFRIISAMGQVYTGRIESLQIEESSVKEARTGQQVGLKISGWNQAKVGDLVECYEMVKPRGKASWSPRGGIFRIMS